MPIVQERPFPAATLLDFIAANRQIGLADGPVQRFTADRWLRANHHFTAYEADKRAVGLGFHPCVIWPNWWAEALPRARTDTVLP